VADGDIGRACSGAASHRRLPDGTDCRQIAVGEVDRIARAFGVAGKDVELAALDLGILPERYERNFQTFDTGDQARLLRSAAAVIGLGGLGGSVLEILARAGVGTLRLVDGDRFEGHNLNRQLLSTVDNLGSPKAQAAARRVAAVNPSIAVEAVEAFMTPENAPELIAGTEVVVDCLDTIENRFDLESACRSSGLPLVSAAIAGASGHVTVVFPEDRGLSAFYGADARHRRKGAEATLGTLPFTVSVAAGLEAAEVLKVLLKRPSILRNRLLVFDAMGGTFDTVSLDAAAAP
jgi:molybdopterin/thiamine biosynthesis adenylyltransferase